MRTWHFLVTRSCPAYRAGRWHVGECYDRHLTELAVKAPRGRARCLPCEYDASPYGPHASSYRPASPYGPEPHESNEDLRPASGDSEYCRPHSRGRRRAQRRGRFRRLLRRPTGLGRPVAMCPPGARGFVQCQLDLEDVCSRSVLEVGSCDPKAAVRSIIMPLRPARYTGADLVPGPGVDVVCSAECLLDRFAPGSFDLVVSTEVLEHVRDWRRVVHNLKTVLREHAMLIVTTRSPGFEFHGFPLDFWRFEPEDISEIFGDLEIETIERDPLDPPGVFFRARRPAGFTERDLDGYSLYSVVRRRRARSLTRFDVAGAHCLAAGQAVVAHLLPLRARHAMRQAANRCSSQARRRGGRDPRRRP